MKCWLMANGLTDTPCDFMGVPPDSCHFISQQTLRRQGDHAHLGDSRNIRRCCRKHHHQMDQGFIRLRFGDFPSSVIDFAFDLNYAYSERGWRKQVVPA